MEFPGNVRIVLVAPEYAGNVGSAARAMHTMGLRDLHVVNPACNSRGDEARWLAHNSASLLDRLIVHSTLEQALADTVFCVGTTRRVRRVGYPVYSPEEAAAELARRGGASGLAIVFGRESSGLTNEELALCSIQSTIPCALEGQSLNLAQAVLIYCYALHLVAQRAPRRYHWKLATHLEMQHFYRRLEETMALLEVRPATTMQSYLARFRRVISRVPVESRDVRLLHKLLAKIAGALGRAD
jgi:TrmH family RNA methyltransferase